VSGPEQAGVDGARRWCAALLADLDELLPELRRLAEDIGEHWRDDRGRECADRAAAVHRQLGHDAGACAGLGRAIACAAVELTPARLAAPSGPLLGSTAAERAEERRGVRIPTLPDTGALPW
jgi:hypothetical protein